MASMVLGTIGAVVGGFFGGPMGAQLGWAAGSMLGSAIDPPDPIKKEGQRLNDLKPQLNTYGVSIPMAFGTVRLAGNVIYVSEIREESKTTSEGGKGGGGPEVETTEYSYFVDIGVAICKGKLAALKKLYANKILIMDSSKDNEMEEGAITEYMTFYDGSEEQEIDPTLQIAKGDYANANRGIAWVMFANLPLAKFGNQIPNFEFEVIAADEDVGEKSWSPVVVEFNIIKNGAPVEETTNYAFQDLKMNPVDGLLYGLMSGSETSRVFELVVINPNTKDIIRRVQVNAPEYYKSAVFNDSFFVTASPSLQIDSGDDLNQTLLNFDSNGNIILFNVRTYISINRESLAYKFFCYAIEDKKLRETAQVSGITWTQLERDQMNPFGMLNQYNYLSTAVAHYPVAIKNGKAIIQRSSNNNTFNIDLYTVATIPEYDWATNTGKLPMIIVDAGRTVDGKISSAFARTSINTESGAYFYFTYEYQISTANHPYHVYLCNETTRVEFYNDPTFSKPLNGIYEVYFEELRGKLYVYYRANGVKKIAKFHASTLIKELEIDLIDPIGSTMYYTLTPNDRKREFFSIAPKVGAKQFYECTIKYDTLEISYKASVHNIITEDTVKPIIYNWRPVYLPRNNMYILLGPADNSRTINGQPMTNKASLFVYNGARYDDTGYSLGKIVRRICFETGMDVDNDLDVTELMTTMVKGLVHNTQVSGRTIIDKLAIIFNFECCESDGKLTYRFKGKDSVRTIKADELSAKFYSAENVFDTDLFINRKQSIELPVRLNIIYMDIDKDYSQNTQEAKRLVNQLGNIVTFEAPVVLNSDEAKKIAERILYTAWIERDIYKLETNYDHADIEPSDVITVEKDGTSHIIRIVKKDESQGICKFEAVAEHKASYVQNGVGDPGEEGDQNIGNTDLVDDTIYVVMDSPIFSILDKDFGSYVAVCRANTLPAAAWKGANVAIKNANQSVFQTVAKITTQSTIGHVVEHLYENNPVVNNSHENVIDRKSSIIVKLFNGELSGCTYEELLNCKNMCYINGKYFQFMNAELIEDKTYKISFLLQNRMGDLNQFYMNIPVNAGDSFVLCDSANRGGITRIDRTNSILSTNEGPPNQWRIWSIGKKMNSAATVDKRKFAQSAKPRMVSNIKVNKVIGIAAFLKWDYSVLGESFMINSYDVYSDNDPLLFEITVIETSVGLSKIYTSTTTSFNYLQSMYTQDLASIGQLNKNLDLTNISFLISKKGAFAGNGTAYNTGKNADTIL